MELTDWQGQVETNVDLITSLDKMVTKLRDLDNQIEILKKEVKGFNEEYTATENELIHTLEAVNKDDYSVKGVARITIGMRTSVKTPKDLESKKLLTDYITTKYGKEASDSMLGINSQTLNSFFKSELEEATDKAGFQLPGIGAPVISKFIRFAR